jgi:ElaB/YqjD/DUF883 family membrane-anchored ribosome-binding protein
MFQPRASDFDSRLSAVVGHLRAIETELGKMGRGAGRRASESAAAAASAGNQIADAIGPILSDLSDRFRRGQRAALDEAGSYSDQAMRYGDQAVRIGSRLGNDALTQIARQAKERPVITLAVAIGIGVLIGFASRRD